MRRYVDLDEALKLFDTDTNYYDGDGNAVGRLTYIEALQNTAKEKLLSLPLADVVEVVRCKDCIWCEIYQLKKDDHRCKLSVCMLYNRLREPDWYCADGKRKEKENKDE